MSTIKVSNLQNASAASPAIVLDANSRATLNGLSYPTEGSLSGRNRVINGSMTVDQRNAGASVTYGSAAVGVDRFVLEKVNLSTLVATLQQVSDGPAGFDKSIKTTITTAQASAPNSSMVGCDQRIEGFNWADMAFGTASAKTFTMSFWVKSSVIGTYPVSFFNAAVNRAYLATYSISSANTWEYKTITIPGDTSGTWNTTNGIGLGFQMLLGGGTDSNGTAGSWGSTYKGRTSACVDLNATLNATWQVTGIQIEAGSVATPFERRSYGQELALCQRYYYFIGNDGTNAAIGSGFTTGTTGFVYGALPVEMRTAPTISYTGTLSDLNFTHTGVSAAANSLTNQGTGRKSYAISLGSATGTTNLAGIYARVTSASTALTFSAEL